MIIADKGEMAVLPNADSTDKAVKMDTNYTLSSALVWVFLLPASSQASNSRTSRGHTMHTMHPQHSF